jgi:hypothetical protein
MRDPAEENKSNIKENTFRPIATRIQKIKNKMCFEYLLENKIKFVLYTLWGVYIYKKKYVYFYYLPDYKSEMYFKKFILLLSGWYLIHILNNLYLVLSVDEKENSN